MAGKQAVQELQQRFPEQLSVLEAVRQVHGQDEGPHQTAAPDAVLFAESTEDVCEAVKICAAHKMPIIPYGAGTSLEGQVTAPFGGLSIDLSRMNQVVALNENDMDIRVQAGMTRKALNSYLRDKGLFFPVDPGADATIGGMVSTRASGTNAVKYGTIREQLLSLQVVTPSGDIIETGTRSKKSAAGYDLTHLFAGSEGTLGVVTEVTLRLHPIPEAIVAGTCCFPSLSAAIQTVISTIQLGMAISRIELLDALSIQAVNAHSGLKHTEKPTLFVEFSGSKTAVTEQITQFEELAADFGGADIIFAESQEKISELWHARHQLYYATRSLEPGKNSHTTDVCVPISKLADCMLETRNDLEASGLTATMLGHVGDGNFHTIILVDGDDPDQLSKVADLTDRMARRAIDMDGTCTGEHGIGIGKQAYLLWERGEAVAVMQQVKQALDPQGIMNPGKIFRE